MIDGVKEPFDVHVQHPVKAPASPARRPNGIDGGAFRPVSVRIPMENWFHQGLKILSDTNGPQI